MTAPLDTDQICLGCMRRKGQTEVCPHCGYREDPNRNPALLPYRARLTRKFVVGRTLGKPGGFGVTYLAWDAMLQTAVAVKEYLPRELASRAADHTSVILQSPRDSDRYDYGLDQFLKEARTMAQITHPNVVRIREFFRENNTAYLVMDYYDGMPLEEYLLSSGGALSEQAALQIMLPVLDGLAEVHRRGFVHRDIKPANIYITKAGAPILLDFGAGRFAMGQHSQTLSVILTAGFAPFEQYISKARHGPWIDVYACGATLYAITTGVVPQDAFQRYQSDELQAPIKVRPTLTPQFSRAVVAAMAMDASQRPQTAEELRDMLLVTGAQTLAPSPNSTGGATGAPSPSPARVRCPHCKAANIHKPGQSLKLQVCDHCGKRFGEKPGAPGSLLTWKTAAVLVSLAAIVWIGIHRGDNSTQAPAPTVRPASAIPASRPTPAPRFTPASRPAPAPQSAFQSSEPVAQPVQQAPQKITEFQSPSSSVPIPQTSSPQKRAAITSAPPSAPPAPEFAIVACANKTQGAACSARGGLLQGQCLVVRGSLACIPSNGPPGRPPGGSTSDASFRPPNSPQ